MDARAMCRYGSQLEPSLLFMAAAATSARYLSRNRTVYGLGVGLCIGGLSALSGNVSRDTVRFRKWERLLSDSIVALFSMVATSGAIYALGRFLPKVAQPTAFLMGVAASCYVTQLSYLWLTPSESGGR